MLFFKRIIRVSIFCFVFFSSAYTTSFISSLTSKISNAVFCNRLFLSSKFPESLSDLRNKIFGQPFVTKVFLPALENHFKNLSDDSSKLRRPMVARFHGPIGVGKTFAADMLFKMDFFRNKYLFSTKQALLKGPKEIEAYKTDLNKTIMNAVKSCRRSIFVFDDTTEITSAIFSELPPFKRDPQVDYSESLFIYISSAETDDIVHVTSKFLRNGWSQKDFDAEAFLYGLQVSTSVEDNESSKEQGVVSMIVENSIKTLSALFRAEPAKSLWDSIIYNVKKYKNVNDVYIPFLPLERWAVRKCIRNELNALGVHASKAIEEDVLPAIGCSSSQESLEFCPTGCKLVSSKLSIALGKHDEL